MQEQSTQKRILIVEDEKPIAKALQLKLTHEGFSVDVAYDGVEASDYIGRSHYDLILLDIIMPLKDGFSLLKELRDKNIKIPVVITSNLNQNEDVDKAKQLGAVDFITKADTPLASIVQLVNNYLK